MNRPEDPSSLAVLRIFFGIDENEVTVVDNGTDLTIKLGTDTSVTLDGVSRGLSNPYTSLQELINDGIVDDAQIIAP